MVNRIVGVIIALVVVLSVFFAVWGFIFRPRGLSPWSLIKKILGLVLLPFKLILRLFGIGAGNDDDDELDVDPPVHSTNTEIVRHEIGECPPCNVKCPDPPMAPDMKPLEMEISYLKNMVKFVGSMARR